MAGELTITISSSFAKTVGSTPVSAAFAPSAVTITVAGNKYIEHVQNVGTTAEVLDIGDLTTAGFIACKNVDATNYVTIRNGSAGTDVVKLKPGEPACFRLACTDTIVNGAFAADSDWTKGSGWTITGGVGVATGAISTDLSQTVAPLISGVMYRVTYTVATFTAGTITATCGTQAGTARGAAATYVEDILANGTGFKFATSGFTGTIDNVSAVPIPYVIANTAACNLWYLIVED